MNTSARFPATDMPDADWWKVLWPDPESVLRRLGIDFGTSVLDLCCGDGHFSIALAHIVGGLGRVMAVDLDVDLLEKAKYRAQRAGVSKGTIRWIEANACSLHNILPHAPDYVLVANTFHGVPDKPQLAREVFNALKPGGQLAIVNWHARPQHDTTVLGQARGPKTSLRMTPEQVMDDVLPLGFRLHGVVELPPYHYGIVFDKPKVC